MKSAGSRYSPSIIHAVNKFIPVAMHLYCLARAALCINSLMNRFEFISWQSA